MMITIEEFKEKGCIKCGGREFRLGPRGGLSQMIRCKCGQEYVVYPTGEVEVL